MDGVGNTQVDEYILAPDFLDKIIQESQKKIEGEHETVRVLVVSITGRLVLNAQPTSYNLLVNSESGAGKDYITSAVIKLFPKDDVLKRTRISPTAFTYWHNSEKEPEWTWDGKAAYLEDASNAVLNSEVMKTMCSGGSYATITVNNVAKDIFIRGKPVIIITSASANPNKESLRRFSLLNTDESIDQTEAIMRKQAHFAVSGEQSEYNDSIMVALRQLKPYKVRVPFAKELVNHFPSKHLIIRTHWPRFLDLIKASAVLHQYQRETDKDGYLLANGQDYDVARQVLVKTTTNVFMIPLTKLQQNLLGVFNDLDRSRMDTGWYSISELEEKVSFCSDKSIRKNCDILTDWNILEKEKQPRENSTKAVMTYRVKEGLVDLFLPTWAEVSCSFSSSASGTSLASFNSFDSFDDGAKEAKEAKELQIVPPEPELPLEIEEIDMAGEDQDE